MAASTGIAVMVGAITFANEAVFAPLAHAGKAQVNWRIIPATAGWALALAGLEKLSPQFAAGLAWLSLLAVLIIPFGNAPTPLQNAARLLGSKT